MKYHVIYIDFDAVGGIYPLGKEYRAVFGDLARFFGKVPDFIPDLSGIELLDKAIPADYLPGIVGESIGLMVSPRLSVALEPFVSGIHRTYPAEIIHKGVAYEYIYIHLCFDSIQMVDFQASEWFVSNFVGTKLKEIKFLSIDMYLDWIKENGRKQSIRFDRVVLRNPASLPHLFNFRFGVSGVMISETVREVILQGGFTGMDFISASRIITEAP